MFLLLLTFVFRSYLRIIFSILSGILFGLMRYSGYLAAKTLTAQYVGQEVMVEAVIAGDPQISEKETSLKLGAISIYNSTKTHKSQAYAKLSGQRTDLSQSDRVVLRGKALAGFGEYDLYLWHPRLVE